MKPFWEQVFWSAMLPMDAVLATILDVCTSTPPQPMYAVLPRSNPLLSFEIRPFPSTDDHQVL